MLGLMQDDPLRISSLIRHADLHRGDVEIVSRRVEGDLHRGTWRELLASGMSSKEIARAVDVAQDTEKWRVKNLFGKRHARGRRRRRTHLARPPLRRMPARDSHASPAARRDARGVHTAAAGRFAGALPHLNASHR